MSIAFFLLIFILFLYVINYEPEKPEPEKLNRGKEQKLKPPEEPKNEE